MMFHKNHSRVGIVRVASAAASALLFSAGFAAAAGGGATGIDASFTTMLNDLTGMLGGNFGALVLLISLIIGVAVYAITANWRWVISSVLVAFLIGYGVDIVQGIGGVTASVEMLPMNFAALTLTETSPVLDIH